MGQYYKIVNIDKKEYFHPWDFGCGSKLMEFAYPMHGSIVTSALAILLADGNNRGGGDLRSDQEIIGSWAYDRIAVTGDYADPFLGFSRPEPVWNEQKRTWENAKVPEAPNAYQLATRENGWKNVSVDILLAMVEDGCFAGEYAEVVKDYKSGWTSTAVVELAYHYKDFRDSDFQTNEVMGNKAAWFFRTLFPDMGTDFYKTINGTLKHHSRPEHLTKD